MRLFILLLAVVLTSWVVAQATVQHPPQPAGVANAQATPIVIHLPTPTPIPQQETVPASQAQPASAVGRQQPVVVQSSPNQPQQVSSPVQVQPSPQKQLTPAEAAMWCQRSGCSPSQFSPLVESGTGLINPRGLKFQGKGRFYTFTLPADVAMDYWNGFTAHHGVQGALTVEQVAEASIRDFR